MDLLWYMYPCSKTVQYGHIMGPYLHFFNTLYFLSVIDYCKS